MEPWRGVLAVALPAVVAGVLLLVRRPWASAPAAGLAVLAGVLALFAPNLTGQAGPFLGLVALAGAGVGLVPAGRARVALLAALAALPPVVGLWFLSEDYMSASQKLAWGAGEAAVIFASMLALDAWAGRASAGAPSVPWVIASGGAVAVAVSVYPSGGFVAAAVAGALGAFFVLSLWRKEAVALRPAVPAVASVLAGTWLVAYHMNDFSPVATGLLLGAPVLVWAGEVKKAWRTPIAALAVAVPVAVALYVSRPQTSPLGY